jgi:hypothetical protein
MHHAQHSFEESELRCRTPGEGEITKEAKDMTWVWLQSELMKILKKPGGFNYHTRDGATYAVAGQTQLARFIGLCQKGQVEPQDGTVDVDMFATVDLFSYGGDEDDEDEDEELKEIMERRRENISSRGSGVSNRGSRAGWRNAGTKRGSMMMSRIGFSSIR